MWENDWFNKTLVTGFMKSAEFKARKIKRNINNLDVEIVAEYLLDIEAYCESSLELIKDYLPGNYRQIT